MGLVSVLCAALAGAKPVAAGDIFTSIDLDYTYSQKHLGGDVTADTTFSQKYEIRYETSLTTAYDFLGAVRLSLQDSWNTDQAGTSQVSPTLEMSAKGSQAAAKLTYEGTISTTDDYQETGEVTTYSSGLSVDLELAPELWPEMRLAFQRRSSYQPFAVDSTNNTLDFQARKDIYALRLEFNLSLGEQNQILPAQQSSSTTTWSAKATYRELLWSAVEFELAYELNESRITEKTQGVFSSETEDYTQSLKTRLSKALDITPRIALRLSWEYEFEQDLLALAYDYTFKNTYVLNLRWEFTNRLRFSGEARRETDHTEAVVGEDDDDSQTDTLKAGFDYDFISWLRFAGSAELKWDSQIMANSGGSVDRSDEEKYELIAKNVWSDFWDLTVNATSNVLREDGWLTKRETKLKADLRLTWEDLIVEPSYEIGRTNEWEWGFEDPIRQNWMEDAKISFKYRLRLADLVEAGFSHEYGVKVEQTLDEVLDFERTLQFNEATTLAVAINDLIRDLRLQGVIERRASDTEDDPDPQVVDVSYALDLGYKLDELIITSSLKYNDKGDSFDDLSFNTKVGWRFDRLQLTGEYQFDKIYADSTDEKRKLNLKLLYQF